MVCIFLYVCVHLIVVVCVCVCICMCVCASVWCVCVCAVWTHLARVGLKSELCSKSVTGDNKQLPIPEKRASLISHYVCDRFSFNQYMRLGRSFRPA